MQRVAPAHERGGTAEGPSGTADRKPRARDEMRDVLGNRLRDDPVFFLLLAAHRLDRLHCIKNLECLGKRADTPGAETLLHRRLLFLPELLPEVLLSDGLLLGVI